ncbi:class I adenylate-forming enzyme family protein [Pseudonocardia acidicola]|uniref:AMP-binding protein n=1 Tax=Pseudonocardia acidicola TaxID=2724939 RepID=A0ABX1SKJ7_9PSEU|nr:AMP-binding protein [Pseudonocardia acidicola]NMI01029.1 AMP-binding protein [Pseudonocardia acidicola]
MLAVELVRRGAARHANRTAVLCGAESMTFAEVDEAANRMAHVLTGLGAGRGVRIGLLIDNGLWSIPVDFACLKAGAVRVPLNARLSADEQARMLAATGVRLLVHGAALAGRAAELAARVDGLALACVGRTNDVDAPDLLAEMTQASAADPRVPADPGDPVLVLYTSGTTGALKAVVHTQAGYAAITANILGNLVSPGRDSVMLHAASLIHASGTFVLPYWLRGGAAAVLTGFDPTTYLDAAARYRATEINLVPTMFGMLVSSGAAERADVSGLRTAIYGASPMPRPLLEQMLQLWGPRLVQYYGQTEAPLAITVLDAADHTDPELLGSCGHPSADALVAVTDEAGVPVPTGEVGELRVRAPFAMAGYHGAPELTAQTLTADGWVRTRDLARFDERGYLTLVDRTSDMIITGGYNVYPREVEEALLAHPAVTGAAVVGAPDPTWVEAVTAYVTLLPDAEITPEHLRDAVRARLAGYKVPKTVRIVDGIPTSPVGKILRRELRDPLWSEGGRR